MTALRKILNRLGADKVQFTFLKIGKLIIETVLFSKVKTRFWLPAGAKRIPFSTTAQVHQGDVLALPPKAQRSEGGQGGRGREPSAQGDAERNSEYVWTLSHSLSHPWLFQCFPLHTGLVEKGWTARRRSCQDLAVDWLEEQGVSKFAFKPALSAAGIGIKVPLKRQNFNMVYFLQKYLFSSSQASQSLRTLSNTVLFLVRLSLRSIWKPTGGTNRAWRSPALWNSLMGRWWETESLCNWWKDLWCQKILLLSIQQKLLHCGVCTYRALATLPGIPMERILRKSVGILAALSMIISSLKVPGALMCFASKGGPLLLTW